MSGRECTIGIDYGTESGRVLVLDARSGEELGVSVVPYPSAVIDRTLPSTGERLPPDWALQDPDDWVKVLEDGVPAAVADAGVAAGEVVGLGVDFTSCTVLPVTRRRHAAVHARRVPRAPPRLAQAVEAPRRPAGGRPSQRGGARARRAVPGALRRAHLLGVVLPQAHRGVVRGSRGLRRLRGVRRGDGLDRLAPHRTRGPPERHRRLQGDVVTGGGAAADRVLRGGLPRVLVPGGEARDRVRPPGHQGGHAHRRARRRGWA